MLRQLREHGIAIALDDFGIGYSSLASLEQLPLAVTAEGIECVEQLSLLADLKPICLQGYLLARPVAADQLLSLIETVPDQMVSLLLMQPAKHLRIASVSDNDSLPLRKARRH